jgi:hypothetical protein
VYRVYRLVVGLALPGSLRYELKGARFLTLADAMAWFRLQPSGVNVQAA